MKKREMIERALTPYMLQYAPFGLSPSCQKIVIDALAEQAIVIGCEVEIYSEKTLVYVKGGYPDNDIYYWVEGGHGEGWKEPTKKSALAIVILLEEE